MLLAKRCSKSCSINVVGYKMFKELFDKCCWLKDVQRVVRQMLLAKRCSKSFSINVVGYTMFKELFDECCWLKDVQRVVR